MQRAVTPMARAARAARRRPKTYRPLKRARMLARRASKGKEPSVKLGCEITPPAAQDGITGWALYYCPTGVLMCPNGCCAPPECRGGKPGVNRVLGFQGDIGAGTGGSFLAGARSLGVTTMDGVEIAQGLAQIEGLRDSGQIDRYYAGALRNAYLQEIGESGGAREPFAPPSPLPGARILAPGAMAKMFRGKTGPEVGPAVQEACGCTPREPDARFQGWLVYYVPGGVLLTPTKKCIGYYGKPVRWLNNVWRNILTNWTGIDEVPDRPAPPPPEDLSKLQQPAPVAPPPAPPKSHLCYEPRIWPPAWRPQSEPCTPPQIEIYY